MAHADGIGDEARIGGPFGLAEALAEDGVEAVVAAADQDVAIGCWKGFVWHNRSCAGLVWQIAHGHGYTRTMRRAPSSGIWLSCNED